MGRPSMSGLPEHLWYDKSKGVYRLVLINGKRKSLGKDKYKAVALANAYNNEMRGNTGLQSLIEQSTAPKDAPSVLPLDAIHEDVLNAIKLGDAKQRELKNDFIRAKEYFTMTEDAIDVDVCFNYLTHYHPNLKGEAYNKKITFLERIFKFAKARGLMKNIENPAANLIRQQKNAKLKDRIRLSVEGYKAVYEIAPLYMQTAMDLALQLTQGREEIRNIKYKIKDDDFTSNGCKWFDKPTQDGIYGTLFIHRKKVVDHEAAHVAVPIGQTLKDIIDRSKDLILCPYVVHKKQLRKPKKMSKEKTHERQLKAEDVSNDFTDLVNRCGFYDNLPEKKRPTFHEIRALGAHLIKKKGVDPQARLAHTDPESTKIYTTGHVDFVQVQHVEIAI